MEKTKSKAFYLFSKRKNLTSNYILTYLDEVEVVTSMKVSKSLFNAGKDLLNSFQRKIKEKAKNFKIDLNEEFNTKVNDKNILEHIKNKNAYHISNTKSNYIQFTLGNKYRYFALANGESWAHSNNSNYWVLKKLSNSTLGMESYYLKDVCWLDLNLNFAYVKPGKYKVYLRHGISNLSYFKLKDELSLKIFIKSNKKDEEFQMFETSYMNSSIIDEIKNKNSLNADEDCWENRYLIEYKSGEQVLKDSFITNIDIPESNPFDEEEFYKVSVRFFHKIVNWKSGWLIDAAILKKI